MFALNLNDTIPAHWVDSIPAHIGGGCLILSQEAQLFLIGMPDLKMSEIESAKADPIKLGFLKEGDAVFIIMKIGETFELDFSYNYNVGEESTRGIKPIPYEQGYGFGAVIYDTNDLRIKALRFFTMTPQFSEELFFSIEMAKKRLKEGKYNFKYYFDKAMKKYPNPRHMWKDCKIVETAGQSFDS